MEIEYYKIFIFLTTTFVYQKPKASATCKKPTISFECPKCTVGTC